MIDSRCSIPLCERTPTREWDTLHDVAARSGTLGAVPVCEFHLWLLEHGAKINTQFRGVDDIV